MFPLTKETCYHRGEEKTLKGEENKEKALPHPHHRSHCPHPPSSCEESLSCWTSLIRFHQRWIRLPSANEHSGALDTSSELESE